MNAAGKVVYLGNMVETHENPNPSPKGTPRSTRGRAGAAASAGNDAVLPSGTEEEHEAATRIQAVIRGNKTRRNSTAGRRSQHSVVNITNFDVNQHLPDAPGAMNSTAGDASGYGASALSRPGTRDSMRPTTAASWTQEDEAAARLQARIRGMETRKRVSAMKEAREDPRFGYSVRPVSVEAKQRRPVNKDEQEAALKIQRNVRGRMARKQVNNAKEAREKSGWTKDAGWNSGNRSKRSGGKKGKGKGKAKAKPQPKRNKLTEEQRALQNELRKFIPELEDGDTVEVGWANVDGKRSLAMPEGITGLRGNAFVFFFAELAEIDYDEEMAGEGEDAEVEEEEEEEEEELISVSARGPPPADFAAPATSEPKPRSGSSDSKEADTKDEASPDTKEAKAQSTEGVETKEDVASATGVGKGESEEEENKGSESATKDAGTEDADDVEADDKDAGPLIVDHSDEKGKYPMLWLFRYPSSLIGLLLRLLLLQWCHVRNPHPLTFTLRPRRKRRGFHCFRPWLWPPRKPRQRQRAPLRWG